MRKFKFKRGEIVSVLYWDHTHNERGTKNPKELVLFATGLVTKQTKRTVHIATVSVIGADKQTVEANQEIQVILKPCICNVFRHAIMTEEIANMDIM